jgi:hypothetical protein
LTVAAIGFAKDEDAHATPGRALARSIRSCAESCSGSRLDECILILDLNGAVGRAAEWGHCQVHLDAGRALPQSAPWLPAQSFGETGAATGALAVTMALQASRRGYLPPAGALITLSSSSGRKASVWLRN